LNLRNHDYRGEILKKRLEIGISYDMEKPKARKLAKKLEGWLKQKEIDVFDWLSRSQKVVITLGGDGLILHTANQIARINLEIPIIRINFGTKGFLTNVKPSETFRRLEEFLEGRYILTKRTRIEAVILRNGTEQTMADALNEITIERTITRAVNFPIMINSKKIKRRGDGIIFSTRTGSTAYNLSARGPILTDAEEKKIVLTVVCPTDQENSFYFVRPANSVFKIGPMPENSVRVVADGDELPKLLADDVVIIRKSPKSTVFVEFGDA
jgi:NAD+ kinase